MSVRNDMVAHLDLKRARRRRRRIRRALVGLVAFILAGVVGWLVWFSDVFDARDVTVEGNALVSTDEIVAAARVPEGTPLARIHVDSVAQRVKALPAIADVNVSRRPMHEVKIRVTERQLVFQREAESGYQWVDAEGQTFWTTTEPAETIIVHAPSDDLHLMEDIATVVTHLPDSLDGQVSSLNADSESSITINLADGRTVMWGGADLSVEKREVLEVLLKREGTHFDISAPSHPAVR